jgi:2-methylcitrate dehydratase PrpD
MTAGLGETSEIERTGYKFYGACRNIRSTLDVVLELADEVGFDADDVDRIEVVLATTMAKVVDDNALTTHNLQFVVAAALTDGEVGRAQTSTTHRRDPRLLELASRVELSGSEALEQQFPRRLQTQVRLCLKEGERARKVAGEPARRRPVSDRLDRHRQQVRGRGARELVARKRSEAR